MTGYEDPTYFGRLWAADYDDSPQPDPADAVEFLAALAAPPSGEGGGRALEMAIGTGRVALPLAAKGVEVEGVEASPEMVARMRAKPGGDRIPVVIGDMAEVAVEGPFTLVYLVFNTIINVLTQERQVACFRNAARALAPGGAFVIECFVPEADKLGQPLQVNPMSVGGDSAMLEIYSHDVITQRFMTQRIHFTAAGAQLRPFEGRYCWPAELDLMAEIAGLRRSERYADWRRAPFDSTSRSHVSVYRPR